LKSKYSFLSLIIVVLIICLSIIALIGGTDIKVIMPYMLGCLGLFQIFTGLHFYKQDRKSDGILLIISSIFIFAVLVKILLL